MGARGRQQRKRQEGEEEEEEEEDLFPRFRSGPSPLSGAAEPEPPPPLTACETLLLSARGSPAAFPGGVSSRAAWVSERVLQLVRVLLSACLGAPSQIGHFPGRLYMGSCPHTAGCQVARTHPDRAWAPHSWCHVTPSFFLVAYHRGVNAVHGAGQRR